MAPPQAALVSMGGKPKSEATRLAATTALALAGAKRKSAPARELRALVPRSEFPANPAQFMHNWSDALKTRHNVRDAPRSGRLPKMPDAEADECLDLLFGGFNKGAGHFPFESVAQAAHKSKRLSALMAKYGYSVGSLWRRLKARDPTATPLLRRYYPRLSPQVKAARLAYCKRLLGKGTKLRQFLARVVWVDSKTQFLVPKPHYVYVRSGADATHPLAARSAHGGPKVVYYAAVNAVFGACWAQLCSGTTGYARMCNEAGAAGKTYKVGRRWAPASNA